MKKIIFALVFFSFFVESCTSIGNLEETQSNNITDTANLICILPPPLPPTPIIRPHYDSIQKDSILALHDTSWIDMELMDTTLVMDIRYATTNNFMEFQVYDCPKCFIRLGAAKALLNVQNSLKEQGLGLKMFDCYRPSQAQYKLWKKMPDRRYVADPRKGSVHGRGGAVDLTIVDLGTGREMEMGTGYDYFGKEAYWSYRQHPEHINNNRQLLRSTMEEYGFKITTTEWWHYSYRRAWYKLSNMQWNCD